MGVFQDKISFSRDTSNMSLLRDNISFYRIEIKSRENISFS